MYPAGSNTRLGGVASYGMLCTMRSSALVIVVAACGSNASGPELRVTTSFPITTVLGTHPSPLDPLQDQTVSFEISWPAPIYAMGGEPAGCHDRVFYGESERVATGATATTVQNEVLDILPDWDVGLELCDGAGSSVSVDADIDGLNFRIQCFALPPNANAFDADHHPQLRTYTASQCQATLLDVVANRTLGADNFTVDIATGPDHLP